LVQQAIYNEDHELVPPWQAPFAFRKGALVAVEAQLFVYHFLTETKDSKPSHARFPRVLPALPHTHDI